MKNFESRIQTEINMKTERERRVDIIIPVYNTREYLTRCLDSIKAQTYGGWRAICVDDGSTDGSGTLLDEYAGSDPERIVVVHRKNGGISAARNTAMALSDAEWVMFVDSDDLIHPQTLEIALYLADRDNSDIVSWYRSRAYRWQTKLRRFLGLDTIGNAPWGYSRHYDPASLRTMCTDDLAAHCSELTHPHINMPIKHFYVWRHLFRREKIKDIPFVEGLKFEDFPWWSAVMLRDLRATVTNLFLYYRYPNPGSTVNTVKTGEMVISFLRGMVYSWDLYSRDATPHKMREWSHNCKWVVAGSQVVGELRKVHDPAQIAEIRRLLFLLWTRGAFEDCASSKERITRALILKYISAPDGSSVPILKEAE